MGLNLGSNIIITLYVINLALPIVLLAISSLLKFWSRGRTEPSWFDKLQGFKWERVDDIADPLGSWLLYDLLILGTVSLCLGVTMQILPPIAWVLIPIAICTIVLPRYICDVLNSLRWNYKKQDSERLLELEEEIRKIKSTI